MCKSINLLSIMLLVTLALFGVASFYPVNGTWGINHLRFLPELYRYLFGVVSLLVIVLIFVRFPENWWHKALQSIDNVLWGGKIWGQLLVSVLFMLMFYGFRTQTHFLGDGYTWLSNLGSGEAYLHKWTEPGSLFLVRGLQAVMGGYTQETALRTFQILSILSGGIVVYNLISILKRLCLYPRARLLGLVTLLGSGVLLLFCGYVEFYHVLWAAAAIFINVSLKYLVKSQGMWQVIAAFVAAVLMHLEALYLIGGVIFLLSPRLRQEGLRWFRWNRLAAVGVVLLIGVLALRWLYVTQIGFEMTFLPLFTGRPSSPEYAIFTAKHFADLGNLLLLLFPGVLVILAFWLTMSRRLLCDQATTFLLLLSAGSLTFLMIIDPTIGLGRDWDLMSLTLLPPCLLVLHQVDRDATKLPGKTVVAYALVCGMMTFSFLSAATAVGSSVDRYHSLLEYYGSKHRSGWTVLMKYLRETNDLDNYRKIAVEMKTLFPSVQKLIELEQLVDRGNLDAALKLARELYQKNPYEPEFLQAMGYTYGRMGVYDSAEYYYREAIKLRPHHALLTGLGEVYLNSRQYFRALAILKKAHRSAPREIQPMELLGLTYLSMGYLDSAAALADTLFIADQNSPEGHLIQLVASMKRNEVEKARYHFQEFLRYGTDRHDYDQIRRSYNFLLSDSLGQ